MRPDEPNAEFHDVTGIRFEDAWPTRAEGMVKDVRVPVLGRDALVQNKRAAGRHKDLGDVEALENEARRGRDTSR